MEKSTVMVELIVCEKGNKWDFDYVFVKTFHPKNESLAEDALMDYAEKVVDDDIVHIGVNDVRVAEPKPHMKEVCEVGVTECPECEYYEECFDLELV